MDTHPTNFKGSIPDAVKKAIQDKIEGSLVDVEGGGGHYTIAVTAAAFVNVSKLECQRMVYGAIAHLMSGDAAPVHAVDSLRTMTP